MESLSSIKTIIEQHYRAHGSTVAKPLLLAVSKLQSVEKIRALANQGQKDFAENYVQEALLKQTQLQDLRIDWHLIGHLQKNKIKQIIGKFSLIHSIDSLEVAELLNKKCEEAGVSQRILLQVNIAGEATKQGFDEDTVRQQFTSLKKLSALKIEGLMTMPPLDMTGEATRPIFQRLRKLRGELGLVELSMGTSHDFKVALEEGATIVRLGTILFGERK